MLPLGFRVSQTHALFCVCLWHVLLGFLSAHAYGFLVTLKTSPQKPRPMCLLLIRCHCLTGRVPREEAWSSLCTYSMDPGLWKHQWGQLEGGERWKRGKGRIRGWGRRGRKGPTKYFTLRELLPSPEIKPIRLENVKVMKSKLNQIDF